MSSRFSLLAAFMLVWVAMVLHAEPVAVAEQAEAKADPVKAEIPPALDEYLGRRIAQTMHFAGAPWLVRDSREREEEPAKLMEALKLKRGMVVCDLGAGNGFYTLRIARAVGPAPAPEKSVSPPAVPDSTAPDPANGGRAIAVEIQNEMLAMLKLRADREGVTNIDYVLGEVHDPRLKADSCDMILLVDVYHEFSHPVHMLKAMREALKKDGRLVLVEFRAEDRKVPIKELHKMSKAQIFKELTANGYKLVDQVDDLPWQHVMFFQRDDGPDEKVELKPWTPPVKVEKKAAEVLGD